MALQLERLRSDEQVEQQPLLSPVLEERDVGPQQCLQQMLQVVSHPTCGGCTTGSHDVNDAGSFARKLKTRPSDNRENGSMPELAFLVLGHDASKERFGTCNQAESCRSVDRPAVLMGNPLLVNRTTVMDAIGCTIQDCG